MTVHDVLEKLKSTLQNRGKIHSRSTWLWDLKTAYYRHYSEQKFHSNFVNHIYGWMAIIALAAAALIVVLLSTIAMPGIAMLGVGLAITAIAVTGIGVLAKFRWDAHLSMINAQKGLTKSTSKAIPLKEFSASSDKTAQKKDELKPESAQAKKDELKQLLQVHNFLSDNTMSTNHRFVEELSDIVGVELPAKNKAKRLRAIDFAGNTKSIDSPNDETSPPQKTRYYRSDAHMYSQEGRPTKNFGRYGY